MKHLQDPSVQGVRRIRQLESSVTKAVHEAPVEDASHQQAMQHGKGGVEAAPRLQRQLGQRFKDLPNMVSNSPNATVAVDASLSTDITPGEVWCWA